MSSKYNVSAVALKRDKTKVDCPRRTWVSIEKGSSPGAPEDQGSRLRRANDALSRSCEHRPMQACGAETQMPHSLGLWVP